MGSFDGNGFAAVFPRWVNYDPWLKLELIEVSFLQSSTRFFNPRNPTPRAT